MVSGEFLLDRIGGDAALEAAVEGLYSRLVADEKLAPYFKGVDMNRLKTHQRSFFKLAFTKIPESVDVPDLILNKHKRLFKMGLNADHFDMVAGHLIATFESLQVPQALIDEAVGIVAPLRSVFEKGAEIAASA
uniref:Globin family profile domain-containing protein n=1 Tax=Eucampia antarctica TaxID=49252 RepID=A0A7S2S1K5_9STRA|mmetsp:Transcript_29705/g.28564  ORF Transcript_29705/g.28564 Transcript_29705/m.28564 type:complete len:134 (+) Transcript_29705:140-541(+)|eukprot:CAMPEP_0197831120 /NCGR_PEP_ID=MMETSP1437-20131217/7713_1 /TAXON_ID=49252 ORGANISM="Eucampia antarctica, Strain CCMP1452" /NCGR_SAMPLE_ID=MMETSP1437 /ASSEMBLY_ACC=CAM_ASM_001096 /LENGTH=133 /DNA_ID=CAMNT_0043433895 /DNA_START=130 /DNA_END=531 /DNA_ORIENTATION=-